MNAFWSRCASAYLVILTAWGLGVPCCHSATATGTMAETAPRSERIAGSDIKNLRVVVRPRWLLTERELSSASADPYAAVIVGKHLAAILAINHLRTVQNLSTADLEAAGYSFDEAFELALRQTQVPARSDFVKVGEGVYRSRPGEFFASSWLMFPTVFRSLGLRGDPIVVVASRQSIFVTGADEPEGIEFILSYASDTFRDELQVSTRFYRLSGSDWRGWEPVIPEASPSAVQLFTSLVAVDYGAAISGTHNVTQLANGDVNVLPIAAMVPNANGQYVTLAFWVPDAGPALLPAVQRIALIHMADSGEGGELRVVVDWSTLVDVVGHRLVADGRYPERYLWTSTLSPSEWQRLMDRPSTDLTAIEAKSVLE